MIKMVLLGNSDAGKTSLICWFANKKFDSSLKPTIGCDFHNISIKVGKNQTDVTLQVWDTAG